MIPVEIVKKYYDENSELYKILTDHCFSVTEKALAIAQDHPEMELDKDFIYEAGMIHDIGIIFTDAPNIKCFGKKPYICHGYLGSDLMKKEGFPKHALVCERHTGVGLSKKEIEDNHLPLPHRDMIPVSLEEQLICFADKFFSKTNLDKEKDTEKIRKGLSEYGERNVQIFDHWCKLFLG